MANDTPSGGASTLIKKHLKRFIQGMLIGLGAVLPGDFRIKKSKLRGVVSMGMLCSQRELGITEEQVAYIGDDVPDVPLLRRVGFSACPADAHKSAASVAVWQSAFCGGRGAVREFADLLLEAKERINA